MYNAATEVKYHVYILCVQSNFRCKDCYHTSDFRFALKCICAMLKETIICANNSSITDYNQSISMFTVYLMYITSIHIKLNSTPFHCKEGNWSAFFLSMRCLENSFKFFFYLSKAFGSLTSFIGGVFSSITSLLP